MRAAHQIQTLGVVCAAIEKLLERFARIAILAGGDVGRADLAPDFVLGVKLIALHDLLEMTDCFRQTILSAPDAAELIMRDRKSTRLNSSHTVISYAVFCLKKKNKTKIEKPVEHRRTSLR